MILSDKSIKAAVAAGTLGITPFNTDALQPASLDCCLGNHYLFVNDKRMTCIRMTDMINYTDITADTLILPPQSFVLATTVERIALPRTLTAFVEGRSSIGRMGLFIQNAGWVDAGFEGRITLELYNANSLPIELVSGRRICQLVFCRLDAPAQQGYTGKYQHQDKTTGSRISIDFDAAV